jgi:hypothetical protein
MVTSTHCNLQDSNRPYEIVLPLTLYNVGTSYCASRVPLAVYETSLLPLTVCSGHPFTSLRVCTCSNKLYRHESGVCGADIAWADALDRPPICAIAPTGIALMSEENKGDIANIGSFIGEKGATVPMGSKNSALRARMLRPATRDGT